MRIRFFLIPIILIVSFWSDTSLAYKIHAEADTVFIHAKRGATNGPPGNLVVISSREGEDSTKLFDQGWDTIRVSLAAGPEFAWATWQTHPIPMLGDVELYLEYTPTSLARTTAVITVVGDSNTIQIVVIGIPDTNYTCLQITGGMTPSIPEGGSGLATDTIHNLTDSAFVIDSVTFTNGDSSVFAFQFPSFPVTIPPHSALPIGVGCSMPTPALKQFYYRGFSIWNHDKSSDGVQCAMSFGTFNAYLLEPWDTIILILPPTASDTLTIDVHAALSQYVLVIRNLSPNIIDLVSAEITDTPKIAQFQTPYGPHCIDRSFLSDGFCFDDTLFTGQWSDTARFTMQVTDSGTYPIDLLVNYVDGPQTQKYTILAHYVWPANADVQIPAAMPAAEFSLNPNPASGEVTISLPSGMNSTIEIYDVLGNLVLSKQASGSFVWNGQSSAGEMAKDGAYIVRVRESQASGQLATASKRLMLLR